MKQKAVVLSPKDNVATALISLPVGETLELEVGGHQQIIKLNADIPLGHKFSIQLIAPEENIIKYGEIIGKATEEVKPGEYVHIHNVAALRGRGDIKKGGDK